MVCYLSISIQPCISRQLTLPEGAQSRVWHTSTALSLGPGRTQVTMFGGCPKWEWGKSLDVQQKLAKTTVLDFGELNTHNSIHSLAVSGLFTGIAWNRDYLYSSMNDLG